MVATRESLTIPEAAQQAEVTTRTIRNWLKAGKLPFHREGEERRIFRDELAAFLADKEREPAETALPSTREHTAELFRDLLEKERERSERLARENMELAGRVGFYQGRLQEVEKQVLLLSPPRENPEGNVPTMPPEAPAEPVEAPKPLPWYKRLFSLE